MTIARPALRPAVSWQIRLFAYVALVLCAAIWGSTFFMVKDATKSYSVTAFLTIRFGMATVMLAPLLFAVRRLPTRLEWRWGALGGLFLAAGYLLQTFSMTLNDSSRTGFITGLYVVLVPLLGFLCVRQRISRRIVISMVLAVVGLILISYQPGGTLAGDGLAVLCAIAFAAQILIVGLFPSGSDWRITSFVQIFVLALCCGAIMLGNAALSAIPGLERFATPLPVTIPPIVLNVALFTALMATAVGFAVQAWAQKILSSNDTALIFSLETPFSAIFGVLFLSELITTVGWFGGALIFAGVLLVTVSGTANSQNAPITPVTATDHGTD